MLSRICRSIRRISGWKPIVDGTIECQAQVRRVIRERSSFSRGEFSSPSIHSSSVSSEPLSSAGQRGGGVVIERRTKHLVQFFVAQPCISLRRHHRFADCTAPVDSFKSSRFSRTSSTTSAGRRTDVRSTRPGLRGRARPGALFGRELVRSPPARGTRLLCRCRLLRRGTSTRRQRSGIFHVAKFVRRRFDAELVPHPAHTTFADPKSASKNGSPSLRSTFAIRSCELFRQLVDQLVTFHPFKLMVLIVGAQPRVGPVGERLPVPFVFHPSGRFSSTCRRR